MQSLHKQLTTTEKKNLIVNLILFCDYMFLLIQLTCKEQHQHGGLIKPRMYWKHQGGGGIGAGILAFNLAPHLLKSLCNLVQVPANV